MHVVRRVTGGLAILHTDELTYSIATLPSDPRAAGAILDAYRKPQRRARRPPPARRLRPRWPPSHPARRTAPAPPASSRPRLMRSPSPAKADRQCAGASPGPGPPARLAAADGRHCRDRGLPGLRPDDEREALAAHHARARRLTRAWTMPLPTPPSALMRLRPRSTSVSPRRLDLPTLGSEGPPRRSAEYERDTVS